MATRSQKSPFLSISKICRVCLKEAEVMKTLFKELEQKDILEVDVTTLSAVLSRITSVPVSNLHLLSRNVS